MDIFCCFDIFVSETNILKESIFNRLFFWRSRVKKIWREFDEISTIYGIAIWFYLFPGRHLYPGHYVLEYVLELPLNIHAGRKRKTASLAGNGFNFLFY